jgi:uncharacterized protein YbaP (TraB family)
MVIRAVLAVLVALAAGQAAAQSWATPEACRLGTVRIDPDIVTPEVAQRMTREAATTENGVGRLWRIESPAGAVSHLWGTMHWSEAAVLDLPAELHLLIRKAATVALESDPIPRSRAELGRQRSWDGYYRMSLLPPPPRDLDPRIVPWIAERLAELGVYEDPSSFTDAGLAALLWSDPCGDFLGGLPVQDALIATLAHASGAKLTGLEPPNSFIAFLSDPARPGLARAMLELAASSLAPKSDSADRATYAALYRQGRISEMLTLSAHQIEGFFGVEKAQRILAQFDDHLLHERNRNWLPAARSILNRGNALIAVGTYHLPGPQGLVALLRSEGYRVERVQVPGEAP